MDIQMHQHHQNNIYHMQTHTTDCLETWFREKTCMEKSVMYVSVM